MSKRMIALGIAILLAGFATIALVSYVQGARDEVFEGTETVSVWVAKDFILAGTPADQALARGLVEQTTVPRKVRADGAIVDMAEVSGKVAAVTILKGEQIVAPRFVEAGQAAGGSLTIPPALQAISVSVAPVPGVSGFIKAGDRISIIAQLAQTRRGATGSLVRYLLQDVQVLAVGQYAEPVVQPVAEGQPPAPPQSGPSTTPVAGAVQVTLALSARNAEKLVLGTLQGQLYFTLLPPGQRPVNTPGRTTANAFDP